jgi:hypothetical protein
MSRSTSLHTWGQATRTTSGAATAMRVGNYVEGQLFIRILSMSGTQPRLRPRWEAAPRVDGPFARLRTLTTLLATGVSLVTLTTLGAWGRPAWTIAGTGTAVNLQSWFVGSW